MLTKPRLTAVAWFFLLLQGATAKSAQLQLVYISDPRTAPFSTLPFILFGPRTRVSKQKRTTTTATATLAAHNINVAAASKSTSTFWTQLINYKRRALATAATTLAEIVQKAEQSRAEAAQAATQHSVTCSERGRDRERDDSEREMGRGARESSDQNKTEKTNLSLQLQQGEGNKINQQFKNCKWLSLSAPLPLPLPSSFVFFFFILLLSLLLLLWLV